MVPASILHSLMIILLSVVCYFYVPNQKFLVCVGFHHTRTKNTRTHNSFNRYFPFIYGHLKAMQVNTHRKDL